IPRRKDLARRMAAHNSTVDKTREGPRVRAAARASGDSAQNPGFPRSSGSRASTGTKPGPSSLASVGRNPGAIVHEPAEQPEPEPAATPEQSAPGPAAGRPAAEARPAEPAARPARRSAGRSEARPERPAVNPRRRYVLKALKSPAG